jgi:hypothetical protein
LAKRVTNGTNEVERNFPDGEANYARLHGRSVGGDEEECAHESRDLPTFCPTFMPKNGYISRMFQSSPKSAHFAFTAEGAPGHETVSHLSWFKFKLFWG